MSFIDKCIAFWRNECGMYFPDFSDYLGGNPFETTNEEDEFYVEDICSLEMETLPFLISSLKHMLTLEKPLIDFSSIF